MYIYNKLESATKDVHIPQVNKLPQKFSNTSQKKQSNKCVALNSDLDDTYPYLKQENEELEEYSGLIKLKVTLRSKNNN